MNLTIAGIEELLTEVWSGYPLHPTVLYVPLSNVRVLRKFFRIRTAPRSRAGMRARRRFLARRGGWI